jgi:hypothetical protein
MSNTEFTIKNKLMEVMSEFDTWCFCNNIDCIKAQNFDLAVKDLEAFISDQVAKARIDELEHIVSGSEYSADDFDWYEKTQDEYTGTRYYSEVRHLSKTDRIAELKRSKE